MNIITIDGTKQAPCGYCAKVAELRPYGKNGALICFECAMKDEEEAHRQFKKMLGHGKSVTILIIK